MQFVQCFGFDLVDVFVGDVKLFVDFFKGVVGVYVDVEVYVQYFGFFWGEVGQYVVYGFRQIDVGGVFDWGFYVGVFDEVVQMGIFVVVDWGFY